ncbi:multicopper oxidase family protein [Streptomyces carpinensis]|uniref:Multicopper oxidase CueO n=1 Tax=Streptomyces carpinensis TaxID=66369 RepID=A0ABV1W823_9ACTN|nr:multicopper oxidase domain-containing protein [Streptomyces carpinensis]
MVDRRSVLSSGLAAAGVAFTGAALGPVLTAGDAVADTLGSGASPVSEPFCVPLPVPRVLSPVSTIGGVDVYRMSMRRTVREIFPGLPTEVLTYNGHFPGPVIRARSGRPVIVRQHNLLERPAAVHLHGASLSQRNDGNPMNTIAPGGTRSYVYPNRQPHASLWYHDHAHHMESEHVYRGLSGFYLLSDATECRLPLPSGDYDLPIAIRDAHFDDAGRLVYVMGDRSRTTLLANGVPYPYLEVAARRYRFRLLNSSNDRMLRLGLADGGPIVQIGSDGGLLPCPYETDSVFLSSGERADVVIDFSRYPVGTRLVLQNKAGSGAVDSLGQVLRFDVTRTADDPTEIPAVLRSLPPLPKATAERTVTLYMDEGRAAPPRGYIDGKVYDPDRVDSYVRFGASEIWTVTNVDKVIPHNFHIHLVQFRVLERNGRSPGPAESGLKDTVVLMPGDTVKLQATFDTYRGRYVYHCHMLDHSAMGMMATMKIV